MASNQGLTVLDGHLVAAWKGEVGDDRLFYSRFDGTNWQAAATFDGNSSVGPSLASWGGAVYAAWKGENADERVFCAMLGSDGTWGPPVQFAQVGSSVGPALAAYANTLVAAWKGPGTDQSIWYATRIGFNWVTEVQIPNVASSTGPSLADFQGKLYAAWKGENNDQGLYYASYDLAYWSEQTNSHWSGQTQIPDVGSSVGPALAAFGGRLYAVWKGVTGDNSLYYASFDGSQWSGQAKIPAVASSIGPALAVFDNKLYAMWKGSNDVQLWYAYFDGVKWSSQAAVPGNTGQDLPHNIGLRMQYQETEDWCWIAVATSIHHFYDHASTLTQCELVTELSQAGTVCCPKAPSSQLAAALVDPYSKQAFRVLNDVISPECIYGGAVVTALGVHGNFNGRITSLNLVQITSEIGAGRPIAVDIKWFTDSHEHCVAIVGVLNDTILVCDPFYGETALQYELFPTGYPHNGGAAFLSASLTKPGS